MESDSPSTQENAPEQPKPLPKQPPELLIINADINGTTLEALQKETTDPSSASVLVFICTRGGDPHTGYRIGRTLQNRYKHITMVVAGPCKSTGTLIATAAHELVMTDEGELGPLDVQVWKRGEIYGGELTSSSILFQALGRVTLEAQDLFRRHLIDMCVGGGLPTETAAPVAASIITGLLSPIFAQMDPHQLGEVARANDIGLLYATRLGQNSGNLREDTPVVLAWSYPDHGFVIDRAEAADLFNKVRAPNEVELLLISKFGANVRTPRAGDPCVRRLRLPSNHDHQVQDDDGPDSDQDECLESVGEPGEANAAADPEATPANDGGHDGAPMAGQETDSGHLI